MIKYRVWDNKQNKYIDSDDVSISGDGILTVVGVDGKYDMSVQPPNDLAPRFIIEQYTGLKDDNGVEIAVGDIVRAKGYSGYNNHSVVYSERFASFDIYKPDAPKMRISDIVGRPHTDDIEVIGNIHENSELLEEGR